MSATYRLIVATLYRQGHYTSFINTNMHGWLFYDGLKGKLQELTAESFDESSVCSGNLVDTHIKNNS